jgi:putative toxin-antitoxin system antitoxin component (TIGR02293 family)
LYVYLVKLSQMKHGVKSKEATSGQTANVGRSVNQSARMPGTAHKVTARKRTAGKNTTGVPEQVSSGIARWLGGKARVKQDIRTNFDIIRASESGITKASVDELSRSIGVSKKDMAEEILNVSIKTLERKQPSDKLDKKISSHALEVARVMQHAFEIFEDEEKAKQWLNRANRALNGIAPVHLLDTMTGINMVNDVLTRIEEGVYS